MILDVGFGSGYLTVALSKMMNDSGLVVVQDKNADDSEKSEDKDGKVKTIYDNIDYLFGFLKESTETKGNYVLVGYFYKILNHLINTQSSDKINI